MTEDQTWLRREVKRDFAANVRGNIGAWCDEGAAPDPELGRPIYGYADSRVALILYENGLQYRNGDVRSLCAYIQFEEVVGLHLTELVRVARNPESPVKIEIKLRDGTIVPCWVPLKVYSPLFPLLVRILARGRS